jgi:hypothetical protein
MLRKNTVLLNGYIVGIYSDEELDDMLMKLAYYYKVGVEEFVVSQEDPLTLGRLD